MKQDCERRAMLRAVVNVRALANGEGADIGFRKIKRRDALFAPSLSSKRHSSIYLQAFYGLSWDFTGSARSLFLSFMRFKSVSSPLKLATSSS